MIMDTLQNELNEMKNFIADLKADRAAQKEKEKREAWTKYTSLSIVFIAVLAAVATQWAGKYSSRVDFLTGHKRKIRSCFRPGVFSIENGNKSALQRLCEARLRCRPFVFEVPA